MIKFRHFNVLLTGTLILASCARETDTVFPESQPAYKIPINWEISSAQVQQTKALINNNLLQAACTPNADSSNESIGVWGEYSIEENGQTMTYEEFNATPLTFAPKVDDTNPHNDWNYPGETRYWTTGGIYDFRACYPQSSVSKLMTQMEATIFQGGPINTSVIQEDLLVAATQVNTLTDNLAQPVSLDLQHIFAAIKFTVKAADGFTPPTDEKVTGCWLQNNEESTELFSPSGYLVHSGNQNPELKWYTYESSTAPMYVWKHDGVEFDEENTLYTANNNLTGSEYTALDGWVLIVPQQVKEETLNFCYTMKTTGEHIYSVKIPAVTYENGKQYTYTLVISGSKVQLKLTIAEWNKLYSTYDIIL